MKPRHEPATTASLTEAVVKPPDKMSSDSWSFLTGDTTLQQRFDPIPRPKAGLIKKHWTDVSDDHLANLDLEIEGPDKLPGIVTEIPAGHEDAYMEFTYDLRGTGRDEEFVCVHGHHRHLHGAVMRKGDDRFLVGWICAETIYGENLTRIRADYDAAVLRRGAILRVRALRKAVGEFSAWADQVSVSGVLDAFDTVRTQLERRFPWVFQVLQNTGGRRINGVIMPRYLCAPSIDSSGIEGSFVRLMKEVASVTSALTGDAQRVAGKIGSIRSSIESIIRRAELVLVKLADVELFFQPATLSAIYEYAENAVPRRTRHYPGLLKLTARNQVVEMPAGFAVPSRAPIDHLQAALSG